MIFTLTSSAIPPMSRVAGFRGSERLSQPYVFDIYFTVDNIPGVPLQFDLSDAVYSKATLTIALGQNAPWSYSGILAAVRLVRAADSATLFHATLVPQVWQLNLTKHSRLWTKRSCIDVIGEVLDEAGIDHELRLDQAYAQEEQITQYKESNLAFIQRWMDREGLYYFFEQGDNGDVLIITDNKSSHGTLRTSPVRYWPQSDYADISAKQAFDNFAATHNALPASVKLIDYDYARPLLDVSSTISVEANAVGEIAEYGGRFFTPQDAQRLATVRAQEQIRNKTTFRSTGAATELAAGFKYTLEDHPLAQYNAEYLVTAIEHYGYDAQFGPAWGSLVEHKYGDVYRVELDSLSAEVQYRNGLVTAWPRIDGYENAVVDGPAQSIYAQIDDQGRYNIKFKFDEGTNNNGKASTFVRMAQPHGGSQEGMHFPLRKNTEVICSFLGGDPDRPVITGVVHNMLNQSVVTQSNHTQNIIRSGSLNHLVMEDTAGSMWVEAYCPIFESTLFLGHGEWNFHLTTMGNGQIHTEINLQFDVNNEWKVDVVNNTTWFLHNELLWVVDNNVNITYSAMLDWEVVGRVGITYDNTFDFHVVGATTEKFDATLDVKVTGNATYLYEANVDTHIVGNLNVKIDGNEDQNVLGNRTRHVGGNETVNIDGNQVVNINGTQTVNVNAPYSWIKHADEKTLTYGATLEMFVGAKASLSLATGFEFYGGTKTSIQVGAFADMSFATKFSLTVGAQLEIFAGLRMSLIAALQFSLSATNFSLTGVSMGVNLIDITFPSALTLKIVPVKLATTAITIYI